MSSKQRPRLTHLEIEERYGETMEDFRRDEADGYQIFDDSSTDQARRTFSGLFDSQHAENSKGEI